MDTQSEIPNEILLAPSQVKRDTQSRLPSAGAARQGLYQLLKEDEPRSYERALVQGCYDGNRPYNQKTLDQNGQRWMCNLNFRGLEGTLDMARTPYYGLISGVPTQATFKYPYVVGESSEVSHWERCVDQKYNDTIEDWDQYGWHLQASQFEMLFEGWGPIIRDNDADWRFRAVPARAFLVPQDSPSCLDHRVPYFMVRCPYRVHELFDMIRDEAAATARGWNVQAVKNAIRYGTRSSQGDILSWQNQPWEEIQKRYRDKSLISSYTECDVVRCAHVYVMEYTGKVSHFIITQGQVFSDDNNEKDDQFLFADINKYDGYNQIAHVPFQNTGSGTWHSVKGIGLKSFGYEEVQNRLNCNLVNNAMLAGRMVLQMGDAKTNQKMQLMVNSAVTYIPAGATFVDHRLGGDIPNILGVTRLLENKLANKIGAYNQGSITREDGRGEKATATEVELAAAKEGSLRASQIDNYYRDLDRIHKENYRRLLISSDPAARKFRESCQKAGVPREFMDDLICRANRLSGYGSPQMRKMATTDLMAVISMLPEEGRSNALDDIITATQGVEKTERYNPKQQQPGDDEWMAFEENDNLRNGEVPPITPRQNSVIHLGIHLGDAEKRLAPLQQAIEDGQELPPEELQGAFQYVSALAIHCEEHLAQIKPDETRRQLVQIFEGKLKIITAFHGKLRSAVRAAAARQAQAQREQQAAIQLSALDQAKLASAEQKMQIDAAKAQQQMQIKADKAAQQNRISNFQARTTNQRETAKTIEEIRLDRIKTRADVENKRLNATKKNGSKKAK